MFSVTQTKLTTWKKVFRNILGTSAQLRKPLRTGGPATHYIILVLPGGFVLITSQIVEDFQINFNDFTFTWNKFVGCFSFFVYVQRSKFHCIRSTPPHRGDHLNLMQEYTPPPPNFHLINQMLLHLSTTICILFRFLPTKWRWIRAQTEQQQQQELKQL